VPPVPAFPPNCGGPEPIPGSVTIDVHTHIFNATDLQVEPFITRVAASEVSPSLRRVIAALATILQWAGWNFAPDGKTELRRLEAITEKARATGRAEVDLRRAILCEERSTLPWLTSGGATRARIERNYLREKGPSWLDAPQLRRTYGNQLFSVCPQRAASLGATGCSLSEGFSVWASKRQRCERPGSDTSSSLPDRPE